MVTTCELLATTLACTFEVLAATTSVRESLLFLERVVCCDRRPNDKL